MVYVSFLGDLIAQRQVLDHMPMVWGSIFGVCSVSLILEKNDLLHFPHSIQTYIMHVGSSFIGKVSNDRLALFS